MIKNYIFDLYGTLVDIQTDEYKDLIWKRMASYMTSQGAVYAPDELRAAYKIAVEKEIEKDTAKHPTVIRKHIEPDILYVFESLYTDKDAIINKTEVCDTALLFRRMSTQYLKLYPDAKKVLTELRARGNRTFLLSNAQSVFSIFEMRRLDIISMFDGIVLSSDVGIKKPDKKIFDYILSRYRLYPDECLMIGNDMEDDMQGASSAGITGLYIHSKQSPCRPDRLRCDCREINRLSDILLII